MCPQATLALTATFSYSASVLETYVRSHERGIKNLLDYVNISEAHYDDIVIAVDGFSGNVLYWLLCQYKKNERSLDFILQCCGTFFERLTDQFLAQGHCWK